jgi:hypothetical protein
VTAPAQDRPRSSGAKPSDPPSSSALSSDIAVKRVVSLLSELVAAGALPAL